MLAKEIAAYRDEKGKNLILSSVRVHADRKTKKTAYLSSAMR